MLITWFVSLAGVTRLNIFLDVFSYPGSVVVSGDCFNGFVYSKVTSDLNVMVFSKDVGSELFVKRDDKALVFLQVNSIILELKVPSLGFFFFISIIWVLESF